MSKKQAKNQKKERKNERSDQDNQSLDSEEIKNLYDKPVKEKDANGQEFWSLTRNKRISVSTFKGKPLVNLRQFFEKDGAWYPTKKGISLTKESWGSFKKLIGDIDKAIQKSQQ